MELTPKRPSIEDAFPLAHRETSVDGEAERLFTPGQLETGLQELDCDFDLDLDEPFGHCVTPEVPLVPQFPNYSHRDNWRQDCRDLIAISISISIKYSDVA